METTEQEEVGLRTLLINVALKAWPPTIMFFTILALLIFAIYILISSV